MAKKKIVRLYRFYNMEQSKDGTAFALCDEHRKNQRIPPSCVINKIADKSLIECNQCASEEP